MKLSHTAIPFGPVPRRARLGWPGTAMVAGLLLCLGAAADTVPRASVLPKYQQECAACHLAYPPGLLPAASWQRVMGSLSRHYGTNASLDEASVREIGAWLRVNAGTYARVREEPPGDRITASAWFLRQHGPREIAPNVFKRASVGSPANCAACHSRAPEGLFSEREVRIPN